MAGLGMRNKPISVLLCLILIFMIFLGGCVTTEEESENGTEKNHAPTINDFSIAESWPIGYQISWNVSDEDKDNLTISLYFSYDNQTTWIHINTFKDNVGETWWNFPDTGKKEEYFVKIVVYDSEESVENITEKYVSYPMIHRYSYLIEITPNSSDWNLLYLPVILLSNNSISEINYKLDSNNIQIVETPYGPAIEINTSTYLRLSAEISLTKLDSEYAFGHSLSMFAAYDSYKIIDTRNFTDEFREYYRNLGRVWVYYNNSNGSGNISIKLKFDFSGFGAIFQAVWGNVSVGWQEKEVYESELVV